MPSESASVFIDRINREFTRLVNHKLLSMDDVKCLVFLRGASQHSDCAPAVDEILRTIDNMGTLVFDDLSRTVFSGYQTAVMNRPSKALLSAIPVSGLSSSSSSSSSSASEAAYRALQSKPDVSTSAAGGQPARPRCERCTLIGHTLAQCVVKEEHLEKCRAKTKRQQDRAKAKMARIVTSGSSLASPGVLRMAVDSGCSKHMVPSTVTLSNLRSDSTRIETASGNLHSQFRGSLGPLSDVLSVIGLTDSLFLCFICCTQGVLVYSRLQWCRGI